MGANVGTIILNIDDFSVGSDNSFVYLIEDINNNIKMRVSVIKGKETKIINVPIGNYKITLENGDKIILSKTKGYCTDVIDITKYYKKDIARLKENGICRGCRKRKVVPGKTYCAICLEKKRIRSQEYRRKRQCFKVYSFILQQYPPPPFYLLPQFLPTPY